MYRLILIFTLLHLSSKLHSQEALIPNSLLVDLKLKYALRKDVFSYYSLDEYDTPLKQKVYSETEDYKMKLVQLDSISKAQYYFPYNSILGVQKLKDYIQYDLKSKGFNILLGVNAWERNPMFSTPPKSIKIDYNSTVIWFKTLPTVKKYSPVPCYLEYFFIPVDEKTGLEIENQKDSIDLLFVFTPSGMEKNNYKFFNLYKDKAEDINWNCIVAPKVKVVLINKSSKKVYYSKTY